MRVTGIPYVQGRNAYDDRDDRKYGIAIHNTSNTASAEGEASYAKRRTDGISSHFYVDLDSIVQSVDTKDRCGHAGSANGNENAVCVEITGSNAKTRDWWLKNVAWVKLGAALAQVIRAHWPDGSFQVRRATVAEMKANPKVKAFYGHDDMRRAWGGTTHTDPGPNFPWDHLFTVVKAALGKTEDDTMFCKYGETNDKVLALQHLIVRAGGSIGTISGQPDYDGNYGDNTANGLKAVLGYGDGKTYGPREYADLFVKVAKKQDTNTGTPGPAGPAGPAGPQGPKGEDGEDGDDAVLAPGTVLTVTAE
jgi:N-acetyl-anhydromuramyl-L-alanine amidase AmpD